MFLDRNTRIFALDSRPREALLFVDFVPYIDIDYKESVKSRQSLETKVGDFDVCDSTNVVNMNFARTATTELRRSQLYRRFDLRDNFLAASCTSMLLLEVATSKL